MFAVARIAFEYATECCPIPQCYAGVQESVQLYQRCLQLKPDSEEAAFNLSQSLIQAAEYSEDGLDQAASTSSHTLYSQAAELLRQLDAAQSSRLAGRGTDGATTPISSLDAKRDGNDTSHGSSMEEVAVTQNITNSTVIETILAEIDVQLEMLDSAGQTTVDTVTSLLGRAKELDARDGYMSEEILDAERSCRRDILRWQATNGIVPPAETMQVFLLDVEAREAALNTSRSTKGDPAVYTDLADDLLLLAEMRCLRADEDPQEALALIRKAIDNYDRARTILSSPLDRPSSVKGHHVASLLSANSLAMGYAYLLQAVMALSCSNSQSDVVCCDSAVQYAMQALADSEGPFTSSTQQASKFACAHRPRSQVRQDYRTIAATRDSALGILRVLLFLEACPGGPGITEADAQSVRNLIKAIWPDAAARANALARYAEDLSGNTPINRFLSRSSVSEDVAIGKFANQFCS